MNRIRTSFAALPALLALLAVGAPPPRAARAEAALTIPEQQLLAAPEFAHGDYDGFLARCLAAVAAAPDSPVAELALRQANALRGAAHHPAACLPTYRRLADLPFTNGWNRALVHQSLAALLEESGDGDAADALRAGLGYVHRWCVLGPYGRTESACYDDLFPPEQTADGAAGATAAPPSGAAAPGTPPRPADALTRRMLPRVPPGRELNAFDPVWPREGAVYALAQLQLPAATDAHLLLDCPGAFKLWVNGRPAAEIDRLRAVHPHEVAVRVPLRAGWNRLLLKLVSGSGGYFLCRVVDAAGNPIPGITLAEDPELRPLAPAPAPADEAAARVLRVGAIARYAEAAAPERSPGAWSLAALALLHSFAGEEDAAVGEMKRAVAAEPGSPFLQVQLGRLYEASDFLPATFRINRAKDAYDRALAAAPNFVPALERIALYYYRDEKIEEAIGTYRRAVDAEPGYFQGLLNLGRLYAGQGWKREAEDAFRKLDELYPGSEALAERRIDEARAEKLYPKALALLEEWAKTHVSAREDLDGLYATLGRVDEAIAGIEAGLRREPDDARRLGALIDLRAERAEWDAAKALSERRIALAPGDPQLHAEHGNLLFRAGKRDEAVAAYTESLRLDPSQYNLRRQLAALRGAEDDVEGAYAVDGRTLIPGSPGRREFPKASVLYLLDQAVVRVNADGSFSEVVSQVYKILNEKGIDAYDKVRVNGELLEARTITPDGRILEPILLGGSSELTMPHLEEGSVIEYKWRRHHPRGSGARFSYASFYFQDFNFDGPFQRSRFVVSVPKDFPFRWVERNMPAPATVTEEGDRRIVVWDVKHSELIEEEPHQPSYAEFLPHVYIGSDETWREIGAQYKEFFFGRMLLTRELRARAAELTAGKTGTREKFAAVYDFVNQWVKDDEGGHTAQEILTERGGMRLILLCALAEAAGLAPEFVLARHNRWVEPEPPWELAAPHYFTESGAATSLLRVRLEDGSYVWTDCQSRWGRLGELPWVVQGGRAIVVRRDGPVFVRVPEQPAEERLESQEFMIQVTPAGGARIRLDSATRGEAAARARSRLVNAAPEQRKSVFEMVLNANFPGVKLLAHELPGLDTPGAPLRVIQDFEVPRFAELAGSAARCRLGVPPTAMQETFASEAERKQPLQLSRWFGSSTSVRLAFPPGWHIRRIPESFVEETRFGSYSLLFSRAVTGEVVIERRCLFPPQQVSPADYPAFLELCRRIDAAERKKIQLEIDR
ncbi:MAG: DUF3857 domain-containing protein [Planctomycetes bacterium]|nr:DUF3857 domain-containing protein [Planctomycetota bacterium]